MSKRKVDKTKKSNIKCEYCAGFEKDKGDGGWCCILREEKNYWNRCKNFIWKHDV